MTEYIIMDLTQNIQRLLGEIQTMSDTQNRILEVMEHIEDAYKNTPHLLEILSDTKVLRQKVNESRIDRGCL